MRLAVAVGLFLLVAAASLVASGWVLASHAVPTLPLVASHVEAISDCAPPPPDIGISIPTGQAGNATTPPDRNNTSSSNESTAGTVQALVIHANAESDPKELTLDVSGSHNVFDGLLNSRSHAKVGGSWNLFRHGFDYGQRSEPGKVAFDLTGSNNCFSPIPTQTYENADPANLAGTVSPAGFPLFGNFDPDQDGNVLEHFAPGTTAANAAMNDPSPGTQYFVCGIPDPDGALLGAAIAPGCAGSGASAIMDRNVQGATLEKGLYFVTGRVKISASNVNATLTVVSGQQLNVNGSFQGQGVNVFLPYTDASGKIPPPSQLTGGGGLLFASQWDEAAPLSGPTFPDGDTGNDSPNTDKAEDALKIEGSLSRFEGINVATNGRLEVAGEQLDFRCPVMGDRVRVNGSKNYFNAAGCVATATPNIVKTPDLATDPGGQINVGQKATFTITITNSGAELPTANLDDLLPNDGGLTWFLVSATKNQTIDVSAQCNPPGTTTPPPKALPGGNALHCEFGTLAITDSIVVVVESSVTTSSQHCPGTGTLKLKNGTETAGKPGDAILSSAGTDVDFDDGQIEVICGAIRINKDTTKGGAVATLGAIFSVDGPDAGDTPDFSVTDDTTAAISPTDRDADPAIGRVCVQGLEPGQTYNIDETQAPTGYALDAGPPQIKTVVAVAGDCSSTGLNTVTFVNPPLFDLQVRMRDGGSGTVVLDGPISCNNTTGTANTDDTAGWGLVEPPKGDTRTILGIQVPAPGTITITCTIPVDP